LRPPLIPCYIILRISCFFGVYGLKHIASLAFGYHITNGILVFGVIRMRIDATGNPLSIPEDVVIHGRVPRPLARGCRNCKKRDDCVILRFSLSQVGSLDYISPIPNLFLSNNDLPLPMPCRGDAWEAIPSQVFENNQLVQRLGLSEVGEPISPNTQQTKE